MGNKNLSFRVDTPALFKEIADCALATGNNGIFKIPLNVFMNLLSEVATRATELNDPILNKAMFDLTLYELPPVHTGEYSKLMKKVYRLADRQRKLENKNKKADGKTSRSNHAVT